MEHDHWIAEALKQFPLAQVEAAWAKWRAVDEAASKDLKQSLCAKFPEETHANER